MQTRKQYVLLETLISMVINVALSVGFVYLIFRGHRHIATLGKHGIVLDMVPQTFMVTLMGSLIPMILTRRRLEAGALPWSGLSFRQPGSPLIFALSIALFISFLVLTISWTTLPWLISDEIDFHTLVISKAVFGGLLALMVTPWAINRVLR